MSSLLSFNHISKNMVERAHFTSAKFSEDESEFHHCNFDEEYIKGFNAPFVIASVVIKPFLLKSSASCLNSSGT